jgi:protocatechuate 3,4-dioxygenase alpha subunit
MSMIPNPSQTVGPFFTLGLTERHAIPRIAGPQVKGERMQLTFRVLDGDGAPVHDAMIEIWQADAEGRYNHPDDPQAKEGDAAFLGFGRMGTDEDGRCVFETIRPGCVPGPGNSLQSPHLNLAVHARGLLRQLHTRVYFAGDPANQQDPVLALVPEERRETLIAKPDPSRAGAWHLVIHLQGEQETVFFDV